MYATLLSFPGGMRRIPLRKRAKLSDALADAGIDTASEPHVMYAIDGARINPAMTLIDAGATVFRMLCVEGG